MFEESLAASNSRLSIQQASRRLPLRQCLAGGRCEMQLCEKRSKGNNSKSVSQSVSELVSVALNLKQPKSNA